MNLDMVILGALARLPGDVVAEGAVLEELQAHGLSPEDAHLVLDKALLEGYVARAGYGSLVKLARAARPPDDRGGLAQA